MKQPKIRDTSRGEVEHHGEKDSVERELARRLCAAFVSCQLGVTVAIQNTPEEVGDLWYFLAALAKELVMRSQNSLYKDLGRLATTIIQ
jgi:hypothetical protein